MSQPDFLNTVVAGRSDEPPDQLLAFALELERRLGRVRGERDAPRPLDIDLLHVEGQVRDTPDLTLPHPRLRSRRFVLAPLAELAPDLPMPPDGATVASLLAALPPGPRVELIAGRWLEEES